MAIKYISDLTATRTINDTDVLVIDDGEHNYKITWAVFKGLLGTVASFAADPDQENYPGHLRITLANGVSLRAYCADPAKQDKLIFDDAPTEGSSNPVKSGGVFSALSGKLDTEAYTNFTGANEQTAGTAGKVPAPAEGGSRYLESSGAWETPDNVPADGSDKLITSGAVYAAVARITSNFTGLYSSSETYALGDYCLHEGILYRCTTAVATAEEWTSSHWMATTVGAELLILASTITSGTDAENITFNGSAATHTSGSVAAELAGLNVADEDQELAVQMILNELLHRQEVFDGLSSTVSGQGTRLAAAETSISSLGTRMTTAEGNITTQGGKITALEGKMSTAEGNITKLTARTEIETGTVTLTNSQPFPFNDSQVTVPLVTERANQNYIVDYEVTAAVGNVGDIIVSAKLVNGFKIEHTGSATSVTVKYQVLGGMA